MGFKRFSVLLTIRLCFIMLALAAMGVLVVTPGYHAGTVLSLVVVLVLTWEIFGFVSKTNQELSRFLDAARYSDFGQRFDFAQRDAGFEELGETFTHILDRFRGERQQQESELRHLKALLEHVPVPLVSLFADGSITMWNNAARRLFGSTQPNKVQDLEHYGQEFHERMQRVSAGDRFLANFSADDMEQRLTVSVSEIVIAGKVEKLVSLQNIQNELDGVQLTAWQDLVRVLTHEIMNSITPVASLAKTARDLVDDARRKVPDDQVLSELNDAHDAVDTVSRRSDNLMDFVSNYRQLTRLPEPDKKPLRLAELFQHVTRLAKSEMDESGVELQALVEPESLEVVADHRMMEQVLINLLQNASQALQGQGDARVMLRAFLNRRGHVAIEVSDNGPGVSEEVAEKIFVPFYTTRREGSGVGLALSRQIMIAHGGTITLNAGDTVGAKFTLIF